MNGQNRNMAPPAGWTTVPNTEVFNGTGVRTHAWYRFAGSSEPSSYNFTMTGGSGYDMSGGIAAVMGVSTGAPVNASAAQQNGAASNLVTAPSITTTMPNTLLIFGGACNVAITFTPPCGHDRALGPRFGWILQGCNRAGHTGFACRGGNWYTEGDFVGHQLLERGCQHRPRTGRLELARFRPEEMEATVRLTIRSSLVVSIAVCIAGVALAGCDGEERIEARGERPSACADSGPHGPPRDHSA